ncbi:MAG: hypothetical protein ACLRL6_00420 [Clostridium sp.]
MFGIASIGLAIILFTIIIKALMLPLSIKQRSLQSLIVLWQNFSSSEKVCKSGQVKPEVQ